MSLLDTITNSIELEVSVLQLLWNDITGNGTGNIVVFEHPGITLQKILFSDHVSRTPNAFLESNSLLQLPIFSFLPLVAFIF